MRKPSSHLQRYLEGLALASDVRSKVGVVVLSGRDIISEGHNRLMRVKLINGRRSVSEFSIHAEMDALRQLPARTIPTSIVIFKMSRWGAWKNGRPCNQCMRLIESWGILDIIYSSEIEGEWNRIRVEEEA